MKEERNEKHFNCVKQKENMKNKYIEKKEKQKK